MKPGSLRQMEEAGGVALAGGEGKEKMEIKKLIEEIYLGLGLSRNQIG